MNSDNRLIFSSTMRESRKLFKNIGFSFILFLIIFGLATDYVFVPLLGKLWGLALNTTPDGFISNANFMDAISKSPWIIPIGLAIVFIYVVLSLWKISAIITGIGYAYQGQKIRLFDLIRISFFQLCKRKFTGNWVILLYTLFIVPFASLYQANDILGSFIVPEYIQDFINSKTLLFIIFSVFVLFIIFLALKWFFLLPSFFLKKNNFKESVKESYSLTAKKFIRNWFNLALYSLMEFIRISVLPIVLILLPVTIAYIATSGMDFSSSLYGTIGISWGLEVARTITGTQVQLSVFCFIIILYFEKLKEKNMDTEMQLPALKSESTNIISVHTWHIIYAGCHAFFIIAAYLITVITAQSDSSIITETLGRTEIIAHKGYSSEAPENTMPAFELADECGAVTYMELDVWSTKDGIPVVIHNASIKDATGIDKNIYECTYEEIKDIPAPYNMDAEKFPTATIPTLEDVIKTYADSTPLLIEIKGFSEDAELPAKIVKLMKKYGCEYTSLIHSGDYTALKAVKEIDPQIKCGLILAIVTGNYYDLPYADFFSIEHTFADAYTIENLHKRGKDVFAWTVNYSESAEKLMLSDIDGLITDYPEDINEYVADKNELVDYVITEPLRMLFDSIYRQFAIEQFENGEF